jgi:serine protease Do
MRGFKKEFLRENFLGLSLALIGVACLALSLVLYSSRRGFSPLALAEGSALDGADINLLEQQNKAYERIAESVTPAVVAIQSTQVIKTQQSPLFTDPFFRQFFGNMPGFGVPREQREHALGSGVIVSADGYILTNNHVIRNATSIDVLLHDKRQFKGKVVGADAQSDIAVVKISASNLPTAPLGDSATLHVGDTVMAFGNPFQQYFTVTRGAVSALGRAGMSPEHGLPESFIQTDAAINPGNSGGALVNVRGQVIGIPTFILSGGAGPGGEGSSLGIGFAIPVNMAKHVMKDLIDNGKVSHGYLGAAIGMITPDLAAEFKVPDTAGAVVQDVTPGGPGDRAGLKSGDVIRKFNGQTVDDQNQLTAMVAASDPGTAATLEILRNGQSITIKVTLGERPENLPVTAGAGAAPSHGALRGVAVENLTPSLRDQLGVPAAVLGVVVSEVDENSPAAQVLTQGDVIESINRQPVHNTSEFNRLAAQATGRTLLRINRQGEGGFVVIPGDNGGNDGGDQ